MFQHNTHSKYSPSRMSRIITCPGSISLMKMATARPTSSYAEEGTLLHTYMEDIMEAWPAPAEIDFDPFKDHKLVTQQAFEYVTEIINLAEPGIIRFNELHVQLHEFEDVWGTLDLGVVTSEAVHIMDYKFGYNQVDAANNEQLLCYLTGFLDFLRHNMPKEYLRAYCLPWYVHIVQPRIDNYQMELVRPVTLHEFHIKLERAIRLSKGVNPPFNPGASQCKWCEAVGVCTHHLDYAKEAAAEVFMAYVQVQQNLASIEEVTKTLKLIEGLKGAAEGLRKFCFLHLAKGNAVPGYKLVRGRAYRTWKSSVTASDISEVTGLDYEDVIKVETKSPAQIEGLLIKSKRPVLDELWDKPEGELQMVEESNRKPEVQAPMSIEAAFAGLGILEE